METLELQFSHTAAVIGSRAITAVTSRLGTLRRLRRVVLRFPPAGTSALAARKLLAAVPRRLVALKLVVAQVRIHETHHAGTKDAPEQKSPEPPAKKRKVDNGDLVAALRLMSSDEILGL